MSEHSFVSGSAHGAPAYGATRGPGLPPLAMGSVSPVSPRLSGGRHRRSGTIDEEDNHQYEEIEETAYSGAMATIIKDVQRISNNSKHPMERILRISFALLICVSLIAIQLYVLVTIKTFVTSPAVREIRNVYGVFQVTMYHGHVKDSGYGFPLGIGGKTGPYYDVTQFDKLSDDIKGSVCLIPFSQPAYLSMILFIWSLSVIGELKACLLLMRWLYTIESTKDYSNTIEHTGHVEVIVGMPMMMKGIVFCVVLLPRLLASILVFWLGCRWLSATLDFTEVLINAIALEFVIHLNSLLYEQLVSDRSKRELSDLRLDMRMQFATKEEKKPNVPQFVGAAVWAFIAAVWIYLYLSHLQMVIPGYQWDVRVPCRPWVSKRFNFWRV